MSASDSERQWRNLGLVGGVTGSSRDILWPSRGRGSASRLKPYANNVFLCGVGVFTSDSGLCRLLTGVTSRCEVDGRFLLLASSSTTGYTGEIIVSNNNTRVTLKRR